MSKQILKINHKILSVLAAILIISLINGCDYLRQTKRAIKSFVFGQKYPTEQTTVEQNKNGNDNQNEDGYTFKEVTTVSEDGHSKSSQTKINTPLPVTKVFSLCHAFSLDQTKELGDALLKVFKDYSKEINTLPLSVIKDDLIVCTSKIADLVGPNQLNYLTLFMEIYNLLSDERKKIIEQHLTYVFEMAPKEFISVYLKNSKNEPCTFISSVNEYSNQEHFRDTILIRIEKLQILKKEVQKDPIAITFVDRCLLALNESISKLKGSSVGSGIIGVGLGNTSDQVENQKGIENNLDNNSGSSEMRDEQSNPQVSEPIQNNEGNTNSSS